MNKFIEVIRSDREEEISTYEKRGYIFGKNRRTYEFVRKISFNHDGLPYNCQVRVDFREIRFYLLGNDTNTVEYEGYIYFTIYELYRLLKNIVLVEGLDAVVNVLESYLESTLHENFSYEENIYNFKIPRLEDIDGKFELNEASLTVTYREIYLLLSLIQDKSNYLFSISTDGSDYKDGIIRLMIALLSTNASNQLLESIGWEYDLENDKFNLNKKYVESKEDRASKRYYLTNAELRSILKLES